MKSVYCIDLPFRSKCSLSIASMIIMHKYHADNFCGQIHYHSSLLAVACEFPVGVLVPGHLVLPVGGSVQARYFEGDEVTYQCAPGYRPRELSTAVCGSDGRWSPNPVLQNCTGKPWNRYGCHIFITFTGIISFLSLWLPYFYHFHWYNFISSFSS